MTTAEKLYQVSQELPDAMQTELLDFAEFLKQKRCLETSQMQARDQTLFDLRGGLEASFAFAGDPLAIQEKLRDEWN